MARTLVGDIVLTAEQIRDGVHRVAALLNATYAAADIVTVVPGGVLMTADLVRQLDFDLRMDYISCPHNPGSRENTSEIVFHDNLGISGRDVIVVDDAIESGGTMKRLLAHLSTYRPKSLATVTLFVRAGRVEIPVPQHYGFELDSDELMVGYGLPWQDQHRNLPAVHRLAR